MKNYVQTGDVVTAIAPAALKSGEAVLIGSIFGIAATDAAQNAEVEIALTGVYTLPKVSTDVLAFGAVAYWDATAKRITATASGNTKIGVAIVAAGNPSPEAVVRLNGAF
jgi:predicted RecA/RadA family phage recombinase